MNITGWLWSKGVCDGLESWFLFDPLFNSNWKEKQALF